MATCNFAPVNTNVYYTFDAENEMDSIEFGDYMEMAEEHFKMMGWDTGIKKSTKNGEAFAEKSISIPICEDWEIEVGVRVLVQSGYYAGYCFDYEIYYVNGDECGIDAADISEELIADYVDGCLDDLPLPDRYALFKDAACRMEKEVDRMTGQAEELFGQLSQMKYILAGVFCNGEGIYQAV